MKVLLICLLYLSAIAALPTEDRQSGCAVPNWKGDGWCDDQNNVASCEFDGGDCCGSNVKKTYCTVCACLQPTAAPPPAPTGCAKIPAWMKTAMSSVTGLERIIQGSKAPSPIPWQAHMRQVSPNGGFFYFCGGTILDSKTILTAAHCYHGKDLTATNFFIAAGATHVSDGSAQTAFVESITLHENYNPNNINNDVAILKLKTPLTFNSKVQPACLPAASLSPSGVAVASGWGLVGQAPDQRTHDLMYVAKPVIPTAQCRAPNTLWAPSQIKNTMICAGDADGGESTCKGDSGGPLVIAGADDVATLIGTTSFGPLSGCGTKGLPAVYAYTIPFLDWIKAKMEA